VIFRLFLPLLVALPMMTAGGHSLAIAGQGGNYRYISTAPDTVTRFELASSLAFLAHNSKVIASLQVGDSVTVGGEVYQVVSVDRYQVVGKDYRDETGAVYADLDLWLKYYAQAGRLVMQTCIPGGLVFVVGER
jgi:hypothetical protein